MQLLSPLSTYHKLTSVWPAVKPTVNVDEIKIGLGDQKSASIPSSSKHSRSTVIFGSSLISTYPPGGSHNIVLF